MIVSLKACAFSTVFSWTSSPENFAVKAIGRSSSIQSTFGFDVNENTIENGTSIWSDDDHKSLIGIVIEKKSCCALRPLEKKFKSC